MKQGDPQRRFTAVCVLALLLSGTGVGQFATYISGTYGYQSNPLYDYRQVGDPVRSAYLELSYAAANVTAKYAGGLTLFRSLTDRNFLDHSILLTLSFQPGNHEFAATPDSSDGNEENEEEGFVPPADSLGLSGAISVRATGRHDKAAFREYDNASGAVAGTVHWGFNGWSIRLGADGGYRAYPFTRELSNTSGLLAADLTIGRGEGLSVGAGLRGGFKHFVSAAIDSGRFGPTQTYVTVTSPGSGKGGAKIVVAVPSGKETIINPDVRTMKQLAGSVHLGYGWGTGSLATELLYRHNLSASARILRRTAETSALDEDLYNDFFSYGGPESRMILRQSLPASVQLTLSMEHLLKRFGGPAYDLLGAEIAGTRVDRRTGLEVYVSRYFPLSGEMGFDLAVSGGAVRNESNDRYNDFSGWMLAFSVGVGF